LRVVDLTSNAGRTVRRAMERHFGVQPNQTLVASFPGHSDEGSPVLVSFAMMRRAIRMTTED
jgi:hypothetical protein